MSDIVRHIVEECVFDKILHTWFTWDTFSPLHDHHPPKTRPLRVLDIGAGSGESMYYWIRLSSTHCISYTAINLCSSETRAAIQYYQRLSPECQISEAIFFTGDIRKSSTWTQIDRGPPDAAFVAETHEPVQVDTADTSKPLRTTLPITYDTNDNVPVYDIIIMQRLLNHVVDSQESLISLLANVRQHTHNGSVLIMTFPDAHMLAYLYRTYHCDTTVHRQHGHPNPTVPSLLYPLRDNNNVVYIRRSVYTVEFEPHVPSRYRYRFYWLHDDYASQQPSQEYLIPPHWVHTATRNNGFHRHSEMNMLQRVLQDGGLLSTTTRSTLNMCRTHFGHHIPESIADLLSVFRVGVWRLPPTTMDEEKESKQIDASKYIPVYHYGNENVSTIKPVSTTSTGL